MKDPLVDLDPVKLQRLAVALELAHNCDQFFGKYQADYNPNAIPDLISEVKQRIKETA